MPAPLAILSDSHDRLPALRAALDLLAPHHPLHYLHCGDLCDPDVLDLFAGLPTTFVFGNNDFDRPGLLRKAAELSLACSPLYAELTLAGKRLALTHGDDHALLRSLAASQKYDYLFHGHTHTPRDQRHGRTRIINPGALSRATPRTVALLDLDTDTLEYLPLPDTR